MKYWARFKGPIGEAIGPMLCETLMAEEPLRDEISPTHYGDFNDNPAFEGPSDGVGSPWGENRVVYGWRGHWYDPLLRLVLCRLLRKHRWLCCSAYVRHVPTTAYVRHVPNSRPRRRRRHWWVCRLCGQHACDGYLQPNKPWPRGDQ